MRIIVQHREYFRKCEKAMVNHIFHHSCMEDAEKVVTNAKAYTSGLAHQALDQCAFFFSSVEHLLTLCWNAFFSHSHVIRLLLMLLYTS